MAMMAVTVCSCDVFPEYKSKCHIAEYEIVDSFCVMTNLNGDERAIDVAVGDIKGKVTYNPKPGADNSYFMETYSARYGDVNYTGKLRFYGSSGGVFDLEHAAFWPDPVYVSVMSDADFDEEHAAGTDLTDIIYWSGYSRYPFIKNGYKKAYGNIDEFTIRCKEDSIFAAYISNHPTSAFDCYTPTFKMLDAMGEEDWMLYGIHLVGWASRYVGTMTFAKEPTKSRVHHFTIRIKTHDGQEFHTECQGDWDNWGS